MISRNLALSLGAVMSVLFAVPAVHADDDRRHVKATWELPKDILGTSNQISFNQGANDVWYFMESTSLEHNPVTYRFLPNYSAICPNFSVPLDGLACWWDTLEPTNPFAAYPHIGLNFNDQDVDLWPAQTMLLHPQNNRLAIVAWRSPKDLRVTIEGAIGPVPPSGPACGDGVHWSVEMGTEVLASGDTSQASDDSEFEVERLKVRSGEVLYLVADPKNDDFCDGTRASLKITPSSRP